MEEESLAPYAHVLALCNDDACRKLLGHAQFEQPKRQILYPTPSTSHLMVLRDAANLDFAMHSTEPMLYEPLLFHLKRPHVGKPVSHGDATLFEKISEQRLEMLRLDRETEVVLVNVNFGGMREHARCIEHFDKCCVVIMGVLVACVAQKQFCTTDVLFIVLPPLWIPRLCMDKVGHILRQAIVVELELEIWQLLADVDQRIEGIRSPGSESDANGTKSIPEALEWSWNECVQITHQVVELYFGKPIREMSRPEFPTKLRTDLSKSKRSSVLSGFVRYRSHSILPSNEPDAAAMNVVHGETVDMIAKFCCKI